MTAVVNGVKPQRIPDPAAGPDEIVDTGPRRDPAPPDPNGPAAPDVVVYVSGLGSGQQSQPDLVANLLCAEIDKRCDDPSASFAVERVPTEPDNYHRIQKTTAHGSEPVLDIYVVNPFKPEGVASTTPLRRVVSLALTVAAGFWILCIGGLFRRGNRAKSLGHKLQLAYCLLALATMVIYLVVLVWALSEAIARQVSHSPATGLSLPQWIVLIGAVLGALYPNFRANLTEAAVLYQKMMQYIWTSELRNDAAGTVRGLVDRINRRSGIDRIHLVGFSFGSLVVLDTVLAQSSQVPAPLQNVHSMTTIGCPFDMVRTLRPTYAEGRSLALKKPPAWVNIYAPIDALGSDFQDSPRRFRRRGKGGHGAAPVIAVDRWSDCHPRNETWNADITLDPVNFLMLTSLTSHLTYWSPNIESDSAWGIAVQRLLEDRSALVMGQMAG